MRYKVAGQPSLCCKSVADALQVPIIAPVKQKKLEVNEQAALPTFYSSEFLAGLMTNPELVRNVAVIGHLHHGKSLVRAVQPKPQMAQNCLTCMCLPKKLTSAIPDRQLHKQERCVSLAKAKHDEDLAQEYIPLLAGSCAQVMDMFVEQTHNIDTQMRDGEKPMRFTDTRLDEQERGVSLKMVPMSLVMEGTSGKSYLMNLIDTPGVLPIALVTSTGASLAEVSQASLVEETHGAPSEPISGAGQGSAGRD